MTRERTATPWGIERTRHGLWIGPMRADGMKVDAIVFHLNYGVEYTDKHNERQDANAEFIVRAVNSYDDMLAALKHAEAFINNGIEFGYIRRPGEGDAAHQTLPMIRAAISRAEGSAS